MWVSVKDNGIGMDTRYADKVFTISSGYTQPKNIQHRAGLALRKKIMEQHDGEIWVESELGKDRRFTLRCPFGENVGKVVGQHSNIIQWIG